MKKIFAVLLIITSLLFLTKPSDETCIGQLKDRIAMPDDNAHPGKILQAGGMAFADCNRPDDFRIEDNVFYKTIYMNGSDQAVGIACIGTVFLTGNE